MSQGTTTIQRRREITPRLTINIGSKVLMRFGLTAGSSQESSSGEIQAELVGLSHYEYLILRLPPMPGLLSKLAMGISIKVRFIHEGTACLFAAEVLAYVTKPALLVFISYPQSLEALPLRQHRRITCAIPALIRSRVGDLKGIICDLSNGGCRLVLDMRGQSTARQLQVGENAVLQASLSPDGAPNAVSATLRSVEMEQFRFVSGVSFDSADDRFWASLESFLESASNLL